MNFHVISDLHFNHDRILQYTNRPFATVQSMNEALIMNWNDVVSEDDEVYVVGDMFLGSHDEIEPILNRLNGFIHIALGNHDTAMRRAIYERHPKVVEIGEVLYLEVKGMRTSWEPEAIPPKQKYVFCHYPMIEWKDKEYGSIMCHGHTHHDDNFQYETERNLIHIGADATRLTPMSLGEVLKKCRERSHIKLEYRHNGARE